ncbi:MAG: ABC transporter permease [Polyangiaceae bacterium]|nr:ABC transporter permease [Polyangiaceae bacterium]
MNPLAVTYLKVFLALALPIAFLIWRGVVRLQKSTGRAIVWWLGALLGVAFGAAAPIAIPEDTKRWAPFQVGREVLRFSTLAVGVVFLIFVITALLPVILDALENRGFSSFVGARHVRATKSGFLTVISVLSMAGVGVSSCALCSVTSIMGGFGADLKRKILNNNAHILVDVTRPGGFGNWEDKLGTIRKSIEPYGAKATPVVGGDAMGSSSSNTAGVLVRGVDPKTIVEVIDLEKNIEVGKFDYLTEPDKLIELPAEEVIGRGPGGEPYFKGPDLKGGPDIDPSLREFFKKNVKILPGVIIGKELAKSLHVLVGDEISLLSPMGELGPTGVIPRTRRFRVAGIFYSGMYEYDASHAYILMEHAQKLFGLEGKITNIDIRVPDAEKVKDVRPYVDHAIAGMAPDGTKGAEIRARDWMEMNKNLFSALKLEKLATFIILSIAIAVASFCIVCTLLLMVTEKGKEIAILKALGASNGAIMATFMLEGIVLGGIGTLFGVGTALATCTGLAWFGVRLDHDVYYIDRLPVNVNPADYGLVALAALVICTLATIYPAKTAASLSPIEGLRWE